MVHAADLTSNVLGFPPIINLPGLFVQVGELIEAAARAGVDTKLISHQSDPAIEAIVRTWQERTNTLRANGLGFVADGVSMRLSKSMGGRFVLEQD